MSEWAFLDSNVSVYASGGEHPCKAPSVAILREIARKPGRCWSSAEVLQELLHLFIRRGQPARAKETITTLATLLQAQVVEVHARDVLWCLEQPFPANLQSRDRLHVSVMNRLGITQVISADRGFDDIPGITRLDPLDFEQWRSLVFDA